MSEAFSETTFSYQEWLSAGNRELDTPGLLSVPSLDATLRIHREYEKRLGYEETWEMLDEDGPRRRVVKWLDPYPEMSADILRATKIVEEIHQGLEMLGISELFAPVETNPLARALQQQDPPDDLLLEMKIHEKFPDPQDESLVRQAVTLVGYFRDAKGKWVVDDYHLFAERVAPWDSGIRTVTLDEHGTECPFFESVDGLVDWNEVDDLMSTDGYVFRSDLLVQECTRVLIRIADLILRREQ